MQKDSVCDAVMHRLARIDYLRQRIAAWKGTEDVEMLQENQESGCTLLLFIRVDKPRDYDSLFLNE